MPSSFTSEFGTKSMSKTFYKDPTSKRDRSTGIQTKQITASNFFPAFDSLSPEKNVRHSTAMAFNASFSSAASDLNPLKEHNDFITQIQTGSHAITYAASSNESKSCDSSPKQKKNKDIYVSQPPIIDLSGTYNKTKMGIIRKIMLSNSPNSSAILKEKL